MLEHHRLLLKPVEKKRFDVRLRYNTNFSQTNFKDTEFFELWNQFDNVFIHASLDEDKWGGSFEMMGVPKVIVHSRSDILINELNQCLAFMYSTDESFLSLSF